MPILEDLKKSADELSELDAKRNLLSESLDKGRKEVLSILGIDRPQNQLLPKISMPSTNTALLIFSGLGIVGLVSYAFAPLGIGIGIAAGLVFLLCRKEFK